MMAHQVLFSRKPLSPSFISEFLGNNINHSINHNVNPSINLDALDRFRDDWLAKRSENGRLEVWLFLDGSQTDC